MDAVGSDVIARAIAATIRDVGALVSRVEPVFARRIGPTLNEGAGHDAEWLAGLPQGSCRWVLTVSGSETAIDEIDEQSITVLIASAVQDAVIDATGTPWPEIGRVGVLDVSAANGAACWTHQGQPVAPIGKLSTIPS